LLVIGTLAACDTTPATRTDDLNATLVTAIPTLNTVDQNSLCREVDTNWDVNWPRTIEALEALLALNVTCTLGTTSVQDRLYDASLAYGDALVGAGLQQAARPHYERAAMLSPDNPAVIARLESSGVASRNIGCDAASEAEELPPHSPTRGDFMELDASSFTFYSQPFRIYGVNYVPRDVATDRLLLDTNLRSIGVELDLMRAAGLNTLRLALQLEDLFHCPGDTLANVATFTRLDGLVSAAGQRGFRLILIVDVDGEAQNDTLPDHRTQQLAFLANRYSSEPAVLAYDLQVSSGSDLAQREQVLQRLAQAVDLIRDHAPQQFVTAAWDDDAFVTAPLVDFVSFLSDGDIDSLRQEIAILRDQTQKPILLASIGYDTVQMTEIQQRDSLQRAIEAVDRNNLIGWVLVAAFDHPVPLRCPEDEDCAIPPESRYGIWNTSYYPKRAVDVIKLATGFNTRMQPDTP
jgi:hypothetical protein